MNQKNNKLEFSYHPDGLLLEFRLATEKDLPGLEWEGEYTHFKRLYHETFLRTLTGSTLMWIAVDQNQKVIGQVFIQLDSANTSLADGSNRAYLFGFRVREVFRSQGIGRQMMEFVENDLIHRGYKILCLNVARKNTRAFTLYRRLGYNLVGPDPGVWSYQDDKGKWHYMEEPAWRLEKYLK